MNKVNANTNYMHEYIQELYMFYTYVHIYYTSVRDRSIIVCENEYSKSKLEKTIIFVLYTKVVQ